MGVQITVQETPNPQARRFVLDRPVQEEPRGRFFRDGGEDPLATALLACDGVEAVLLLPTSVTVTKAAGADWADVEDRARAALDVHFAEDA